MGQKLNKLTQVWICSPKRTNIDGEYQTIWKYQKIDKQGVFFNLQQDLNELDRDTTGQIDYDIQKARTTRGYLILKGWGVCVTDISKSNNIKPDYIISDIPQIGKTRVFTLKKYIGE